MKCDKCSDDYILIDDETNICHLKTECDNQNCYEVDEFHYYTCSKTNENCEKCEKIDSDIICNECKADFRLSNNVCYPVIQIVKLMKILGINVQYIKMDLHLKEMIELHVKIL